MRDHLNGNPSMSLYSALICSITAMSTSDLCALIGALGVLISTVWGLSLKTVMSYSKWKEERLRIELERDIRKTEADNKAERYRMETQLLKHNQLINTNDNGE